MLKDRKITIFKLFRNQHIKSKSLIVWIYADCVVILLRTIFALIHNDSHGNFAI